MKVGTIITKRNIKPKYYMIAIIVSFVIVAINFSGVILKNDVVGRLIFGFVWLIVGIGWLGQYFYRTKNKSNNYKC